MNTLLDARSRTVGNETVSVGSLTALIARPREMVKAAIYGSGVRVLLGHQHSMGEREPSPEGLSVAWRPADAGAPTGIAVLDHVVVTVAGFG